MDKHFPLQAGLALAIASAFNCHAQDFNLLADGGFESGLSGFSANQGGTYVRLSSSPSLAGRQSLSVGITGYGDSVLWTGHKLTGMTGRRSSQYTVTARLQVTAATASKINVCAMATYAGGQSVQKCKAVTGTVGDKGEVSVVLPLDSSRDVGLVRMGLFQVGSEPVRDLLVDDVRAVLAGIQPTAAPTAAPTAPPTAAPTAPPTAAPTAPPTPAPTLPPNPAPQDGSNLMSDPGFETGASGFSPNQDGTSTALQSSGAISGANSLQVGISGYGDSIIWTGRSAGELSGRRSSLYTAAMRMKFTAPSSSELKLCAMVDYAVGEDAIGCTLVSGGAGDKGVVSVNLPLDNSRDIEKVRLGLFQEGSEAIQGVLLDDASAVLAGITAVTQPAPGPTPVPTPGTDPVPAPAGTPYPGYTYQLPTSRPFISLDDFNSPNRNQDVYLRLKAKVDDAVRIGASVPASADYAQYSSALRGAHYGYSVVDAVIMYRLTGDTGYIDQAIRMMDLFIRKESETIASGNVPVVAGDSYLEIGWYLEQVALAYDYGHARLTPQQKAMWEAYVNQALFNVWHPAEAKWGGVLRTWSGWSVNDPGNNYYYSFLKATQLWALATQDRSLLDLLQQKKFTQLVPFFSQLNGGGTREGTGYGTAIGSMFENYRYWKSGTGEDLSALSSHARDTIDYWIHATVPTLDYFASIGDQSRESMPQMFDYQRKLMEEAVALTPDSDAGRRGSWWLNRIKVTDGGSGSVTGRMRYGFNYRYDLLARGGSELAPTALSYDASGVGAWFARSDWTPGASWMSFVAGVYDQSHAHQDQGSFSFYKDGWLTVTSNVFSRSGLNQDTGAHNVLRFDANGKALRQNHVTLSKQVSDNGQQVSVTANLAPAYAGFGPAVSNWVRTVAYDRQRHALVVTDNCQVGAGVTPVWQLHVPVEPIMQVDGSLVAGSLRIKPQMVQAPDVQVVDMHSLGAEFDKGYRIELRSAASCDFKVELQAL